MCLIAKTVLPAVDRKHLRMLLCRQTPGHRQRVLLRSLLLVWRGGLLLVCCGESGQEGTGYGSCRSAGSVSPVKTNGRAEWANQQRAAV